MGFKGIFAAAAGLAMGLAASFASASTVVYNGDGTATFTYGAGSVRNNYSNTYVAGFQTGEEVLLSMTINTSTVASVENNAKTTFDDLTGSIVLTGATSGATLDVTASNEGGLRFEMLDGRLRIGTTSVADVEGEFGLYGGRSIEIGSSLFQSIRDAGTTVDDVLAILDGLPTDQVQLTDVATIKFGPSGTNALRLDPVPVPLPTTGLLLAGGLGLMVVARRRRRAA